MAEVVDRHGAERAGFALADREQHVHLARIWPWRDLPGRLEQAVGRLAARREHGDDRVTLLARGHDPPGGALELLGTGDRGAAELHHHDSACLLLARHRANEDRRASAPPRWRRSPDLA